MNMLGPELTLLFNELDRRRNTLTVYEKRLYRELLALKTPGSEDVLELPFGRPVRTPGTSDFVQRIGGGRSIDELSGIVIAPSRDDDRGRPLLQINCGNPNCPTKSLSSAQLHRP